MKYWIQEKLSQLGNYFYVEKSIKRKIDILFAVYATFISLFLVFVVEFDSTAKLTTVVVLLIISVANFFLGAISTRLALVSFVLLVNPILISLMYPIENKLIRLTIIIVLFLGVLFVHHKKIFKIGKVILFINVVFCVALVFQYYQTSYYYQIGRNSIQDLIHQSDIDKDIYVVILDGFPSKEVLEKYYHVNSELLDYLEEQSFVRKPSLSKYTDTSNSLPHIFSGADFSKESTFKKKDIDKISSLMPGAYLKNFAERGNYQLSFTSLFIDKKSNALNFTFGRGADVSIYLFSVIDRIILLLNPGQQFKLNKEIENITDQNFNSLRKSFTSHQKVLNVNHFLTFHSNPSYDTKIKSKVLFNLDYADKVGLAAIKMIQHEKPHAKIIVLSDHGIRESELLPKDRYNGILYIKN